MPQNQKRSLRAPVIVGTICALLAAGYVCFMFFARRSTDKVVPSTVQAKTIRIGTFSTAIDYAPFLVAQAKGWIQAELPGVQLEITTFQTLPSINEALAANRLDVVFEAEIPAIVGRAAGIDIRIIGLESTLTEGILVQASSRINKLTDLKGKQVAALSGSAMHYGLVNLLRSAGLDAQTVHIVNMIPPDAAAAFSSGQVDAWAIWPPWPEQQVVARKGRFLPDGQAEVQSVIVMRRAFIDQSKEAAGIVRAIAKSKLWLQQNETEGTTLIAKQLNLPEEVVRLAWPKHNWRASLSPDISHDIENKATFLVDQKMIQHSVTASDLIAPLGDQ